MSNNKLYGTKEEVARCDLEWLFCFSDADCGIKSNYMAMVNVAIYGPTTNFIDPYNTFILNSTHHKRDLEHVVSSLDNLIQKVLYYSFSDSSYSAQVEKIFKKYTGAAYCNSILIPEELSRVCQKIHLGTATQQQKMQLSQIRSESVVLYHKAIEDYYRAKITLKDNK